MEKLLIEEPEAIEALGIGKTLFRQIVDRGEITSVRVGRRKLFPATSLRNYVERLQGEASVGQR
ncbi:MAG: excisionase family DNA-binding protein [Chloroflexi bacterium]|nr:excisionase family DNA-binding protein [Chloroflexota bacterium]